MIINVDKQKFLSDSIPYFIKYGLSDSILEKISLEKYKDINYHSKLFINLKDLLDFYFLVESNKFKSKLSEIKVTKSDKISDLVFQAVKIKLSIIDKSFLKQVIKYLSINIDSHSVAIDSLYKTSDSIWSWLGSNEIDFSYYSKRISLSLVISLTMLYSLTAKNDDEIDCFLRFQLKSFAGIGKIKNKICNFLMRSNA
jgi:rpsU-divergently transcribed protein